ncbi:MAG: TonB-dependent receptor [Acidobacteria bacterium]|nr:TonB-dependent receptor [Acidobacteriota bacterium]
MAVALQGQPAFGQGYGRIRGVITDPSNAAVFGAKVTAAQSSTGVSTTTTSGADGTFVFPALPPASYNISASSPGFGTYTESNVLLEADAAVTVNIALKVGQANESLVVEAHSARVDTSSSTLSQVVDTERINDLPLNGRNPASLTTLVAGVVVSPAAQADQGNTKTFPVVVSVTANGTRTGQTNYMLDGGNNVDEYTNVNAPFPFPDALEEFSVQTSNYNAEYGQNAGGVVNIVTKSGTNNYHGDLFEYLRNGYFNAPNWFSPGKAVDPLKRNQFGATIGGPFKLPGISAPHSYFFAGYQRTIVRDNPLAPTAAVVPTQAEINGTFNGCLTNPFTGAGYPCTNGVSTIDPRTFDPASVALLKYLPKGDPSSGDFFFTKPVRQNFDEFVGRFDREIGAKDRLSARYYYDRFHSGGVLDLTDLLTYTDQANIGYSNFLVSETHIFSERLLNNFVVNYQRDDATRGPLSGGISVANLGAHIWQPALAQINQIQVTGLFTIGDNPRADFHRFNYTLGDDVHVVRGPHNLSFGVHAELSHIDINNLFRQPGAFSFGAASLNGTADFLLGYLSSFGQASGQFFNNRGHFYGLYGQDSWKVTRRLTLNYGLRWEPFIPWKEVANRMGEFSPAAYYAGRHSMLYPNAPAGLLFDGDPGVVVEGIRHVWTDFMPRVGFAWDIFGTGKTSLRGGAGSFYDTRLSSVFNNIFSQGSPFVTQVSLTQKPLVPAAAAATFSNPYNGITNPFPAPQPPPNTSVFPVQSYLTFDPYHQFSVPELFAWNLALEREFTSSSLVRVAYAGSAGEHLWAPLELNPTFYDPLAPPSFSSPRVYAPTYTQQITEANYGANTNYHSLQVSFEQRMKHGMTILGNYTWSKALDDLPFNASVTAIASNNSYVMPYYEPNFRRLDYGPSDFDHRNVASASYVWDLPRMRGGGPLGYVLNGWQADGIFQFRSGDPLTIVSNSNDNSHTGQLRDRAVQLADPYGGNACAGVKTPCKSFLNPASFTVPAPGTFGDVAKGSVVGPQYADWDVSMMRRFDITERWKAALRADFFNALNHPNFGDPATAAHASNFGRITGTGSTNGNGSAIYDPRIGQLSLQISF